MKRFFGYCAIMMILCLPFIFVHAQTETIGEGIRISPLKFEKTVEPGESITETIKVANESDKSREMRIFVRDFKAEGEGGQPKLLEPGSEEGYFLSSWIEADPLSYEFQPYEEKIINFQVNVPKEAGPGGYYGAIVFGTVPPGAQTQSEDKGAAIATSHQAAALLLYRVAGEVDENAIVKDFKTGKGMYGAPFEVDFTTRIENLGNVHIKPHGMIEIYNMFGEKKASVAVNEKAANILPKSIRRFESLWSENFGFGKYKASLVLSYGTPASEGGEGMKTLDSVNYFWIVPWKVIIPSIIGLISLIALIIAIMKFYKNKAVRQIIEELGAGQISYSNPKTAAVSRPPLGLMTAFFLALIFFIGVIIFFIFFA